MWGVSSVGCVQCGVCPVWGVSSVGCVHVGCDHVGCVQCGVCPVWGVSMWGVTMWVSPEVLHLPANVWGYGQHFVDDVR